MHFCQPPYIEYTHFSLHLQYIRVSYAYIIIYVIKKWSSTNAISHESYFTQILNHCKSNNLALIHTKTIIVLFIYHCVFLSCLSGCFSYLLPLNSSLHIYLYLIQRRIKPMYRHCIIFFFSNFNTSNTVFILYMLQEIDCFICLPKGTSLFHQTTSTLKTMSGNLKSKLK